MILVFFGTRKGETKCQVLTEPDHRVEDLVREEASVDVVEEQIVEFPEVAMEDPGLDVPSICAVEVSVEAENEPGLEEVFSETIKALEEVVLSGQETGKSKNQRRKEGCLCQDLMEPDHLDLDL